MSRFRNRSLVGQRFGRLTVESDQGYRGKSRYYRCICDCGRVRDVQEFHLRRGETRSCGCYHSERVAEVNRLRKHSMVK